MVDLEEGTMCGVVSTLFIVLSGKAGEGKEMRGGWRW